MPDSSRSVGPMMKTMYGVQCADHIVKSFDDVNEAIEYLNVCRATDLASAKNPDVWSIDAEEAGLGQYWKP
jgi:hypothetical protein